MSMFSRGAVAVALILSSSIAEGDGVNNPKASGNGNSVGAGEGVNNLGIGGGAISPPAGCSGVLDLSTGCAQLVAFGGLF